MLSAAYSVALELGELLSGEGNASRKNVGQKPQLLDPSITES